MKILPAGLLLLVLSAAGPLAAQAPDAAARVDEIFARWSSPDAPGCAVGVMAAGRPVFARAYGMADLERDVAATPATIYEAGSVSKQFTAAAVVLLALDGKLSLDDDVRTHVPEIPDYGRPITIRHLLTHTSGLRDWGSVSAIAGWGRGARTHSHEHVLDILSRQSALNFPPGEQYSYSNSGYNLLAIVVERVSGTPFAEFSRLRLFEPLGLTNTQWRDDYTRIVKGRSIAYATRDGGFGIDNPIEHVHGNGGLLTTVGDLLRWNELVATGEGLGGGAFVEAMHTRGVLADGTVISYAAGLQIEEPRGLRRVSHTGSTAGFRAFLARYPDQQLGVALLCNVGAVNPGAMGQAVADIFLGEAARGTPSGAPELVGQVTVADPVAPPPSQPGGDRASGALMPSPAVLAAYVGEYHSSDAETTLTVVLEQGRLIALRRPASRIPLNPTAEDSFSAGGLGVLRFLRDGAGEVVELSLRQDRVHDLRFQRVR